MKAYINYTHKVAYMETEDATRACAIALCFGRGYSDLSKWILSCVRPGRIAPRQDRREINMECSGDLAEAIRAGPSCTHSCPRHPEATG